MHCCLSQPHLSRLVPLAQDVSDEKFCRGMELMEKLDLVYDTTGDLLKLKEAAKKYPAVRMVINHLGGVSNF